VINSSSIERRASTNYAMHLDNEIREEQHTNESDTPYGCPFTGESIVVRLKNDILPSFWARHGYKTIKPVLINCMQFCTNNENSDVSPFFFHLVTCVTLPLVFYMPTLLSPIIETVCPFECAALASRLKIDARCNLFLAKALPNKIHLGQLSL
jgi:hypothetical protein